MMVWSLFIIGLMGLFFYNKIDSIIPMVLLPTTEIIEPKNADFKRFSFFNFNTFHYISVQSLPFSLPFLDKYIIWILKLSPAIISMEGLFNVCYTTFLSIF